MSDRYRGDTGSDSCMIDIIAGARPKFMKVAPIIRALKERQSSDSNVRYRLVHTGQHYDPKLSDSFFEQLGIPQPDVNLEAGSGSHAEQTAAIMARYERLLLDTPSALCLVVGDVTSTMACAILAQKTAHPACACGGRYPFRRLDHARRDQPYGHGFHNELVLHHQRERERKPETRRC